MSYQALALDYDGTLAKDGRVDQATIEALVRWRERDRHLILVTGRRLEPLVEVFPSIGLFHRVVAENGGLLYRPSTQEELPLADPPPREFLERLRQSQVPVDVGRVIVATQSPHENSLLEIIQHLGLEWAITRNKGAVMALPEGIHKATGLEAALTELGLSPSATVGVGDAENDEVFLRLCHLAVAVGNALPALKNMADIVTSSERGAGVVELIHHLLQNEPPDTEGSESKRC